MYVEEYMEALWQRMAELFPRGEWVIWPLAGLGVVAVALVCERVWFWVRTNRRSRVVKFQRVAQYMREGKRDVALELVEGDWSVYGHVTRQLLKEGLSDASVIEAVDSQRRRMERFMRTLGRIGATVAMLGIVGTVIGIFGSFRVVGDGDLITNPTRIGAGIAEASLTAVAGLVVALVVIIAFNAFRVQTDRTLGRMAKLVEAAKGERS